MKKILLFVLILLPIVAAISAPKPVLFGEAKIEGICADGLVVYAYPQLVPSDVLNDTVGISGNSGIACTWKINLNNLATDLQVGDKIIIEAAQGDYSVLQQYTVAEEGTAQIDLDLTTPPRSDVPEFGVVGVIAMLIMAGIFIIKR